MTEKKFYISVFFMFLFSINCFGQGNLQSSIVAKNSIVAHRGAWKKNNFPQNSIASLKEAIRLNCKGSEFDIVLTADDSLVVCHDANYNNLFIQNVKYSDLITLKLSNGEMLPTLREYIVAGKQNNTTTQLFCEFKNNGLRERRKIIIEKTLDCVIKLNAQKYMVYTSFDYVLLKQIRALDPTADIRYITGDVTPEQLKLDKISGTAYYIDTFKNHIEWIESAKKNNIVLGAGNANDVANINWCFENNIDAITTDEPELVLRYQSKLITNVDTILKSEFKVFPNPASDLISIQSNLKLTDDLKVEMIDEAGRTVMTKIFPQGSSSCSFETESLYNTIYFLKIENQELSKTFKVIINK